MRKKTWDNVGWHATPEKFSAEFGNVIAPFVKKKFSKRKRINVLDLFAGDGRLGKEAELILSRKNVHTTYVEVVKTRANKIKHSSGKYEVFTQNAFDWEPQQKFDLVVSNPPYQLLTGKDSKKYGFGWDYAREHSRNLYALGIRKCLEVCEVNGMVAVIAPFSWLRGTQSANFRKSIESYCSHVYIKANNNRGIFKNVHQDVGIQVFYRRKENDKKPTEWQFSYNGTKKYDSILIHKSENLFLPKNIKIKVGSVVWNRSKKFLTSIKTKKAIPLIYGGNVEHGGTLNLEVPKYENKQYIRLSGLQDSDLYHCPLLLIRRVMRGRPGRWQIDSCLMAERMTCAVENHVIAIQLPPMSNQKAEQLHRRLIVDLKKYYYLSGSPNISTQVVQETAARIFTNKRRSKLG